MRRTDKSEAVRTCIGCRTRRLQKEMIRIVRDPDGDAVFDLSGKLPGRGAYVCPSRSCVTGLSSASLSRVLRQDVALPSAAKILSGLDEAITLSNALPYGLTAGLFSEDEDEIERFHSRLVR